MNRGLITPPQEPKDRLVTQVYRVHLDRTAGPVRVESSETWVQMEDEALMARRVHLDNPELQDYQAAQVLLVHRVPEGSEVNQDPEESPAFLDLRVGLDQLEAQDQPAAGVLMDRRANRGTLVIKVHQDHWDPEECRVRMAETVMDLQDLKA